jgi:hypothetical protein
MGQKAVDYKYISEDAKPKTNFQEVNQDEKAKNHINMRGGHHARLPAPRAIRAGGGPVHRIH